MKFPSKLPKLIQIKNQNKEKKFNTKIHFQAMTGKIVQNITAVSVAHLSFFSVIIL